MVGVVVVVVVVVKELMSAGCYLCNGGGHGGGGGGPKFKGKALRAGRGARGRVAVVAGAGKAGPRLLMHHLLGSGYQNTPISRSHSWRHEDMGLSVWSPQPSWDFFLRGGD